MRKMPIRGGAVTVLDQARPNTPTAGLALQDANIVYASVADIRFVPTSGTTTPPSARTIVTASERVTALHAVLTFVYWGEQGGAVRVITSGSTPNDLPSALGFVPTSISTSVRGGVFAQAWTQCGSQVHASCISISHLGNRRCMVLMLTRSASINDSGVVFWGDATGMHRHEPL